MFRLKEYPLEERGGGIEIQNHGGIRNVRSKRTGAKGIEAAGG